MNSLTDLAKANPFSSPFQKEANRKLAFAAAAGPTNPG